MSRREPASFDEIGEEIGKLASQRKLRKCITYIVRGVMGYGV
jgi:hypothetical protein